MPNMRSDRLQLLKYMGACDVFPIHRAYIIYDRSIQWNINVFNFECLYYYKLVRMAPIPLENYIQPYKSHH